MGDLKLNGATSGTITLTPTAVAGTNTITLPASTGTVVLTDGSGNQTVSGNLTVGGNATITGALVPSSSFKRNRLINGNMLIDQRNAGASTTPTGDGTYTLDRWQVSLSAASKFSIQQSSTAPTGFINSALITSLSAYSVPAGGYFTYSQPIEGLNVADLGWGSASAQTVTLSFWVRSSLTGTFGGAIQNSAQSRAYPFSYTISAANTWEQKSVTISGDTTGTWLTTNGVGMFVRFGLGVGSTFSGTAGAWAAGQYFAPTGATSVVGTNGATFYITGVQLEVGTKATPYEMQIYSDQLAQCQRYFETQDWSQNAFRIAIVFNANDYPNMGQAFVVPKRATPSVTWTGNGGGRFVSTSGVYASLTINTRFFISSTFAGVSGTALISSASYGWLDYFGTMQISAEL